MNAEQSIVSTEIQLKEGLYKAVQEWCERNQWSPDEFWKQAATWFIFQNSGNESVPDAVKTAVMESFRASLAAQCEQED